MRYYKKYRARRLPHGDKRILCNITGPVMIVYAAHAYAEDFTVIVFENFFERHALVLFSLFRYGIFLNATFIFRLQIWCILNR
jgi:hypothetical protein